MLENLRRQGASIFIYLIFGLLIAIFVINIGPGSGKRGDGGCSGQSNTIITVDGYGSTQTAYHVAYSGQNYVYQQPPSGRNRVYLALEALIQRELLASAAEERGIRITTQTIQEEIKKGNFFYAGHRIPLGHMVFDDHDDGSKTWNFAKYKRFVSDLNVSLESYQDEQARSMEAVLMSELIQNSVNVSRDEALNEYLFNNTTVQYDVVAFRPDQYKSAMRLTDADLERYVASHEQDVKDRYKADERLYKARKPEMRLREIFIAKLEPEAKPEDKKSDGKPGDAKPGDAKPGDKKDVKPGDAKTGDTKAGDAKAGDAKAGDAKAGDKAADKKTDNKAGDKTADVKAGDKAADRKTDKGDKTADAKTPDKAGDAKAGDAKAGDKTDAKTADKTADKKDAKAGDKAADKKDAKTGDKTAAGDKAPEKKKVGMPIDAAKAKLEAARGSIAGGKQKFADAAKALATDDAKKATGGDLGWHSVETPGFDDKAVNDAVKALKPGEMTPVIVTDNGVYLVMAEAKREGDLSYDQVKLEIARTLALDTWSKEGAKRAALEAQAKATAGTGKNLEQLFKRKVAPPQMTPEMQQMIEQQLQQQTGAGGDEGPSGSIVYESKDIPAAWKDDADGSSSGGSAPASAGGSGTAPKTPGAATPPTPMTPGGATPPTPMTPGGATPPAPMTPGGATPPAPMVPGAPAKPAKPAEDLTPSKDTLPAFGEINTTVEKFGPVPRLGYLPGIGKSKDITTTLFDELGPNQIAKKIYEVEGVYYVVQAAGKSQPKVEDFDKQSAMLIEGLRARRGSAAVTEWLRNKCEVLTKANKITPAAEMVRETDDNGKPLPVVYRPCMTFK